MYSAIWINDHNLVSFIAVHSDGGGPRGKIQPEKHNSQHWVRPGPARGHHHRLWFSSHVRQREGSDQAKEVSATKNYPPTLLKKFTSKVLGFTIVQFKLMVKTSDEKVGYIQEKSSSEGFTFWMRLRDIETFCQISLLWTSATFCQSTVQSPLVAVFIRGKRLRDKCSSLLSR